VNDVTVEREQDAKAELGTLVGPASHTAGLPHSRGVFRAELPAIRKAPAGWNVTIRPAKPICSPPNSWPTPPNTPAARQGSPAQQPTPRWSCPAPAANPTPGVAIVTARAIASGARAEPGGKTAWFTRRPTASAVLPAVTGAPESLSHPRNTPPRQPDGQRWPSSGPEWDAHPRERTTPTMTEPETNPENTEQRIRAARETVSGEAMRLARDAGARTVTRPLFRGDNEPTVRDVEPLAGARAARGIEFAAKGVARDYIRQAREAGHGWEQIGRALRLAPEADPDHAGATVGEAAYTYAVGKRQSEPPWEPRYFGWTCLSCDQPIADRGLIQGPADDEPGHATNCPRLAAAVAEWDTQTAQWAAEWEGGQ
jgi:hypothetical protein